jgi:hypothetical protein
MRTKAKAGEACLDGRRSSPAGMPFQKLLEVFEPELVKVFRLADRRFQALDGES